MNLDLAPVFWKNILNYYSTASLEEKEADLKTFDTYSWQVIQDLKKHSNLDEQEFDAAIEECFVTLSSNATEIELIPGGKNVRVTKQNLNYYIECLINARIKES